MDSERLEQELRDYFKAEVKKVEPSSQWWDSAISRLGERKQSSRPAKPSFWKVRPYLVGIPLSILLLVILVGSFLPMLGGMATPPPPAPEMVSDDSGGAFLVWLEKPWIRDAAIWAQHVDVQGILLWGEKGQQMAYGKDIAMPYAAGDGNGGVLIAWGDSDSRNITRLGSDGDTIWTLEDFTSWSVLGMTGDGSGGAILLRQDRNEQVYVQMISDEGVSLWGEGGTNIGRIQYAYMGMPIVSDGSGGAVVIWEDLNRGGVYAQRISQDGELLWAGDGVPITSSTGETERPQLINDGTGNFIITWTEHSFEEGFRETVYAQKLSADGNRLWGEQGIVIHDSTEMQSDPHLTADGSGGCIVAWRETQNLDFKASEVLAQRVSSAGEMLWQEDGVPVSDITQSSPSPDLGLVYVTGDGAGGGTVIWVADKYTGRQHERQVYAQKLNSDGQRVWSEGEIEVYKNPPFRTIGYSSVISDGNGGFIIGSRVGESSSVSKTDSVYAQKIDSHGDRMWGEGGLQIQKVSSALTVQFIAAGAILAAILVLIGVFRRNRMAGVFTAIMPVLLGIAGLFSVLLVIGPFGYSYSWAYVPDTVLNKAAAFIVPLAALAIGALGIGKKKVTLWVMIPVVIFCALVAIIAGLVFVF